MADRSRFRSLSLVSGDSINLDDARGATLRVGRGRLWVTQHGDPADHVLEAGDAWTIERSGLTIARAQRDALVDVVGPAASVTLQAIARARPLRALADRLGRALRAGRGRRFVPYV